MLPARFQSIYDIVRAATARGLAHQTAEDAVMDGRYVTLRERKLVQFGSCSYLGLETDPRLKDGACDAVQRFGVQFASSRAYVSCPLYGEFEELLERIFGAAVVVAQTTSLAHFAALPVLVGPRDAVLVDQFAHSSLHAVVPTLRQSGARCMLVRHNDMDALERRVVQLRSLHDHIWYVADGVYSMAGDLAPIDALKEMLGRHDQLRAYVDDAHGMSWTGLHGRGTAIGPGPVHPQMVVVLSLAKAFSASGAAVVFADAETARLVRACGSTMIFSGPLQPALLGAGIASARIHLSEEIAHRQRGLGDRIDLFNAYAGEAELSLGSEARTPIRFVKIGSEPAAYEVAEQLMQRGHFANLAAYPAVPKGRAGIRVALTLHQTLSDVRELVRALADLGSMAPAIARAPQASPVVPTPAQ